MSGATTTVDGWISNELTVRDAQGHRVVDVSIAITPQRQEGDRWVDAGDPVWYRASFWDEQADAVLGLVNKGSRVTITGTVKVETWTKGDRSGVTLRLTRPVLSVIASKPARNAVAPSSRDDSQGWAPSEPSPEPQYQAWNAGDETPF